ncbi:MAG: CAF17-like 4Fe-4S cluster assembly/insertion protein YgfZ [Sporichthyaceae bacterium]
MSVLSSPLLALPGAVAADGPDAGVPAHYGNPLGEQQALARGGGFVDLSHRGVVRVSGPDRLSWLHSLTSQHLSDLQAGDCRQALVLSPHGHIEHDLHLLDDGAATWITLEPGTAPVLVEFLTRMKFLLRVEVEDLTQAWATIWIPARVAVSRAHRRWTPPQAPEALGEFAGDEVLVPREHLAEVVVGLGTPAGVWAHEALRIAAHVPRLGHEIDHRTIPHEIGLLEPAVHLNKGCYRGQETVARVHNLGRPPRRLVFLHLDGSDSALPAAGAPITLADRQVGFVGSAARHHDLGPIALGVIKRNTAPGAPLLAAGIPAVAEVVVDPERPGTNSRSG